MWGILVVFMYPATPPIMAHSPSECCFPPQKPKGLETHSSCRPGSLSVSYNPGLTNWVFPTRASKDAKAEKLQVTKVSSSSCSTEIDVESSGSSLVRPVLNSLAETIQPQPWCPLRAVPVATIRSAHQSQLSVLPALCQPSFAHTNFLFLIPQLPE